MHAYVCVLCVCVRVCGCIRQKTTCKSQFSLSTVWVLEIELTLWSLAMSAFTNWANFARLWASFLCLILYVKGEPWNNERVKNPMFWAPTVSQASIHCLIYLHSKSAHQASLPSTHQTKASGHLLDCTQSSPVYLWMVLECNFSSYNGTVAQGLCITLWFIELWWKSSHLLENSDSERMQNI